MILFKFAGLFCEHLLVVSPGFPLNQTLILFFTCDLVWLCHKRIIWFMLVVHLASREMHLEICESTHEAIVAQSITVCCSRAVSSSGCPRAYVDQQMHDPRHEPYVNWNMRKTLQKPPSTRHKFPTNQPSLYSRGKKKWLDQVYILPMDCLHHVLQLHHSRIWYCIIFYVVSCFCLSIIINHISTITGLWDSESTDAQSEMIGLWEYYNTPW